MIFYQEKGTTCGWAAAERRAERPDEHKKRTCGCAWGLAGIVWVDIIPYIKTMATTV